MRVKQRKWINITIFLLLLVVVLSSSWFLNKRPTTSMKTFESDYAQLSRLLVEKRWQEADKKTRELMLKVIGKGRTPFLDSRLVKRFPCSHLGQIDQLWVKYSNGRFGLSIQKKIYLQLGNDWGKPDFRAVRRLGDEMGWRKNEKWLRYPELTFELSAPAGHLPVGEFLGLSKGVYFQSRGVWKWYEIWVVGISRRAKTCNL
ncbi:MAG: GUN4 domain-containing protein [Symploca sp. SIO2D2]|nr:GUN4 domain-containing protein [Symploca sp. SIO2D2]